MGFEVLWVAPTWDCTRNLRQITHYSLWLLPAIESQRKLEVGRISHLALYICSKHPWSCFLLASPISFLLPMTFLLLNGTSFVLPSGISRRSKSFMAAPRQNCGINAVDATLMAVKATAVVTQWTCCALKSMLFIISRWKNLSWIQEYMCDSLRRALRMTRFIHSTYRVGVITASALIKGPCTISICVFNTVLVGV